jgi:hypothetical protein
MTIMLIDGKQLEPMQDTRLSYSAVASPDYQSIYVLGGIA